MKHHARWTIEEDTILTDLAPGNTVKDIIYLAIEQLPHRTPNAISQRIYVHFKGIFIYCNIKWTNALRASVNGDLGVGCADVIDTIKEIDPNREPVHYERIRINPLNAIREARKLL